MDLLILIIYTMIIVIVICFIIFYIRYMATPYYRITKNSFNSVIDDLGKLGEYLTYKELKIYRKFDSKLLFNLYIPKEDGTTAEIDILMITFKGIFVFESKNYSGYIYGSEKDKTWTQVLIKSGYHRSRKEYFYNPIRQNNNHIKYLKNILGNNIPMYSIIVFSERCKLKKIIVESKDTAVIKRNKVINTVYNFYKQTSDDILTKDDIKKIYNKLYPYTRASYEMKNKHVDNINNKYSKAKDTNKIKTETTKLENNIKNSAITSEQVVDVNNRKQEVDKVNVEAENNDNTEIFFSNPFLEENKKCPKCGSDLVLRTATKGENVGKKFYGCSNFPKCRYVENIKNDTI